MAGGLGVRPAPAAARHLAQRWLHRRIRMHAVCVGPPVARHCKTSMSVLGPEDAR